MFGNEVLSVFRNKGPRPMPFRQIAQDFTRDGVYDRYLHMKDMTISGHYAGRDQRQGHLQRHRELDVGGAGQRRGGRQDLRRQADAPVQQLGRLPLRPPAEVQQPAAGCATCGGGGTRADALRGGAQPLLALARTRGVDPYAKMRRELGIPESVQLPR